ncbi:MAG: tetraacyldisaccharide 4'-kinase, partial [Bacteroidales bacterium]|nr:tetraacyldisaccharide 4'-kinase [Bacteroidales bacterium]
MIDKILLFPYWAALKCRHFMYDHGLKKAHSADVPTICVGNVTVGGTGKTPHTEMILRMLQEDFEWRGRNLAVLSRGYKRKTRGFQQVTSDGSAKAYGDEPMQIKSKFPEVTVAVCKSRVLGCDFLAHPEKLQTSKKARKCIDKNIPAADLIILDDAFQHRSLKPSASILLINHDHPVVTDHLMPVGKLRDLPERVSAADIIIITKCSKDIDPWQKIKWAESVGISGYESSLGYGFRKDGSKQYLFFTTVGYDTALPVFPEGDMRYVYSKKLILFSGIANDKPLRHYLSSSYNIIRHFEFADHHKFSRSDMGLILKEARVNPTSVAMTTEKDSQRVRDCAKLPDSFKKKLFYIPIKSKFVSEQDQKLFHDALTSFLK